MILKERDRFIPVESDKPIKGSVLKMDCRKVVVLPSVNELPEPFVGGEIERRTCPLGWIWLTIHLRPVNPLR